jgi:hypothetical protein
MSNQDTSQCVGCLTKTVYSTAILQSFGVSEIYVRIYVLFLVSGRSDAFNSAEQFSVQVTAVLIHCNTA